MVKHQEADLDVVFAALSHSVRRDTLDALGRGRCSVSELAAPHGMSLAGFTKHVRALEAAGLIACVKEGRTVTCGIEPRPLGEASRWLADRQRLWNARLDALGRHLYHQSEIAPAGRSKR